MNLDAVLATLHEPADLGPQLIQWEAAQAAFPNRRPDFLRHDAIAAAWTDGSFGQPLPPTVLHLADRIAGDPALLRLAWYVHWRVFAGPRDSLQWAWPSLQAYLGDEAGLFYLVNALAFIPAVHAYHAALVLPEPVTRDTCRQVASYADNYRRGHQGRLGLYCGQLGWLANYLAPQLYFRLGRFEFWRRAYDGDYRVYRHRTTGETVVLAAAETTFTATGDRCFAPAQPPPPASWNATFTETAETVSGTPVTPLGRARPTTVSLPKPDWDCVLRPGDPILDLHIPAGGNMPLETCAASFREAAAFFHDRFPTPAPQAVVCTSWMFSNQLEECLPADANLVRLLKELYLVPVPCRPNDGLWFVFLHQGELNPATAPRDTRLQRAILDYLTPDRHWHQGGMILLLDDLPRFGTQPYRRQNLASR